MLDTTLEFRLTARGTIAMNCPGVGEAEFSIHKAKVLRHILATLPQVTTTKSSRLGLGNACVKISKINAHAYIEMLVSYDLHSETGTVPMTQIPAAIRQLDALISRAA